MMHDDETRVVGMRFRRVWQIAERIAAHPGHTRRELADLFHLSERQVQADLGLIADGMALPLNRRQGYRFGAEGLDGTGGGTVTLADVCTMALALRAGAKARAVPAEALARLLDGWPKMMPPHLAPLAGLLAGAVAGKPSDGTVLVLARMLVAREAVVLDCTRLFGGTHRPVLVPELLIPYLGRWYVIGPLQSTADRAHRGDHMIRFDQILGVSAVADVRAAS